MRREITEPRERECQHTDTSRAAFDWSTLGGRIRQVAQTAAALHLCRHDWMKDRNLADASNASNARSPDVGRPRAK